MTRFFRLLCILTFGCLLLASCKNAGVTVQPNYMDLDRGGGGDHGGGGGGGGGGGM